MIARDASQRSVKAATLPPLTSAEDSTPPALGPAPGIAARRGAAVFNVRSRYEGAARF